MKVISPPDQITSQQLDVQLNKPVDCVERRSDVCQYYLVCNGVSRAGLAAKILHNTLVAAALNPTDIDLLICASTIAVQTLPCNATHTLGAAAILAGITRFDIDNNYVDFIFAPEAATGLLNYRTHRRVAIVSTDTASRGIDWGHEEFSLILGDDAVCIIVERGDGHSGIIASLTGMYPEGNELYEIRADGTRYNPRSGVSDNDFLFHTQGKPLFRFASSLIKDYFSRLLQRSSLQLDDINTAVPHQTSHPSSKHVHKQLRVPESTLIGVCRFYGNQVAVSIPTALHEAMISGRFTMDKPVMLINTTAGLTLTDMVLSP